MGPHGDQGEILVQPAQIEVVGSFLAVRWDDDTESIAGLETLRRVCPCAHCSGEPDVTGQIRRAAAPPVLNERSFDVTQIERVGQYAISITWGDGHSTGIYTWDLIREVARREEG